MNTKIQQMAKAQSQFESEISRLKQELKTANDHLAEIQQKSEATYKRFEEATSRVMRLEKDLELE
jgi:hypothetical protein